MAKDIIGKIHSTQSFGAVDGPGLRFVTFMQGCALRCAYCHNPDTWDFDGGTTVTPTELFQKTIRYYNYIENGGVTVSGGEPLLQAKFVTEYFKLCKEKRLHTALDTSGAILNDDVKRLLDETDLALLDYKMPTDEKYREYIGCERRKIDEFLQYLEDVNKPTIIRHVVVKGLNFFKEDFEFILGLKNKFKCVEKIEFLPFKKMCMEKYEALKIPFPLKDVDETTEEEIVKMLKSL